MTPVPERNEKVENDGTPQIATLDPPGDKSNSNKSKSIVSLKTPVKTPSQQKPMLSEREKRFETPPENGGTRESEKMALLAQLKKMNTKQKQQLSGALLEMT